MIVTGAWWDLVDELASQRVGPVLLDHPAEVRRSCGAGRPTRIAGAAYVDHLPARCEAADRPGAAHRLRRAANLDERDFFLRKAIGWALRQYARVEPDWVREFVAEHRDRMSPLSVREATKHL